MEVYYILKQLEGTVPTPLELPVGTQRKDTSFRTFLLLLSKKRYCSNPCAITGKAQLAWTKKLVSQKKNAKWIFFKATANI